MNIFKSTVIAGLLLFPIAASAQSLYQGSLFDTSCQGGSEDTKYSGSTKSRLFSSLWTAHSVEGATMFVGIDSGDDDDDDRPAKPGARAAYLKTLKGRLKSKEVVYFMNIAAQSDDGSKGGLKLGAYKKALTEIKTKFKTKKPVPGIVAGVGEIEQYAWTNENLHVDDPKMLSFLTKFVKKNKFPFAMIHFPGGPGTTNFQKLAEIETAHFANVLTSYPETTFLVHLFLPDFVELANSGGLAQLLTAHPNWVFSVDVGNVMGRWQQGIFMCPLMYCCDRDGICSSNDMDPSPASVTAFISEYDQTRDSMLTEALAIYKQYIEAYPDRFAWGTENGKLWHLNSEVFARIIDFSRHFIAGLDPSVQENFARLNARRVFLSN